MAVWAFAGGGVLMAAVGVALMLRSSGPALPPEEKTLQPVAQGKTEIQSEKSALTKTASPPDKRIETAAVPPKPPERKDADPAKYGGMLAPAEDMRESFAQDKLDAVIAMEKAGRLAPYDLRRRLQAIIDSSSCRSTKAGKEAAERLKSMPELASRPAEVVENPQPGLLASVYPRDGILLPWNPDPSKSIKTVTLCDVQIPDQGRLKQLFDRDTELSVRIVGYVDVPRAGNYHFYTNSDDGSMFYVGDTRVVDNDGDHPPTEQCGDINLQAGKHSIRLDYFQGGGTAQLLLHWSGPGIDKQPIPASALFHK